MHTTQTTRYIQHQQRIFRYVLLILAVSICVASFGIYNMFTSSRTAYQVQDLDHEISQLHLTIAQEESQYYEATQEIIEDDSYLSMVAYSPASQNLRYAQAGGAVYSFANVTTP